MENTALEVILALLPFAVMMIGFLAFRMSALKMSLIVWVLELVVVIAFYKMPILDSLKASIWGNITLWTGFLVLWTGQIFGQCFRSTGCLNVMLKTLNGILPTKEGKAMSLVSVVGGYLGAFNGFATYPVTIPGLVNLGISGVRAAAGYLVYFSWSIAFVSLFIAANIASNVTKLPITEIVQTMGLLTLPLVVVSEIGFFRILGFSLKDKDNLMILVLSIIGNVLAVVLFTQIFAELYILTLVAAATFSLIMLWLFSKKYDRSAYEDDENAEKFSAGTIIKAFAPLIAVVVLVIINSYPLKTFCNNMSFSVSLFGYSPTKITLLTAPGFYVIVAALLCHVFAVKRSTSLANDFAVATKRALPSLGTLFLGGAMVQLMLDTSQIATLASQMSQWGASVYGVLLSGLGFLAGMAFGQGIPACSMFSKMQMGVADALGIAPAVLVGIAAMVTMGPANPLKPSLLTYTSSLAGIKGQDGEMFNIMFKWQLIQLLIIAGIVFFMFL